MRQLGLAERVIRKNSQSAGKGLMAAGMKAKIEATVVPICACYISIPLGKTNIADS